jgi:hypothetical protein
VKLLFKVVVHKISRLEIGWQKMLELAVLFRKFY